MKAAKKAVERGRFDQASRMISKASARFKKESATRKPPATEVKRGRNTHTTRNQSSGAPAAKLYKDFHGKASKEVIRLQEALMKAGDYTALGDDPEFWLEPVKGDPHKWPAADIEFEKKDKVKLATDAKGKRLYIVGEQQKLPAAYFKKEGFETDGRYVFLGTCYAISYQTEKVFDGFRTTIYAHEFGEETGERPELIYDQESERLLLVGGAYKIAGVDDALKASPGIVN